MFRQIACYLTLSLAVAIVASGQGAPRAELLDEFGPLPCDDLKSRGWNLITQVRQLPGSRALVYVHPAKTQPTIATAQLKLILADFAFAEIEDRVEFKVGDEWENVGYEFWRIPPGGELPDRVGRAWSPATPDVTRPFIFGYEDEIAECPTFVPRKFAELLKANPGSRANIVVRKSRTAFSSKGFANDFIEELTQKFGVDRRRIKVFNAKTTEGLSYAEFWFVPAKKQ
jgi:hypothetical protein